MLGAASLRASVMETTCGSLFRELERIWEDIGETEEEMDKMLLEIERECLQVYRRKVEEAGKARARLHQLVVAQEAEFAALVATLGEHGLQLQTEKKRSLKEQLAFVTPMLEDLRAKKDDRIKQFADMRSNIEKIRGEVTGCNNQSEAFDCAAAMEEHDLSIRKLNKYQAELRNLQKDKSERLHKVMEYVNEVHSLCGILGEDFGRTVSEVHPSLQDPGLGPCTNISDSTLEGLSHAIQKLKAEKKIRFQKLRETVESLLELWSLLDSPEEEKKTFGKLTCIVGTPEQDAAQSGLLSFETIKQAEAEVEQLSKLKAGKMKEIVLKKRAELEDMCRQTHIEPDMSTAPEKSIALIDSGLVDPSELLANIETQIAKVKEESLVRKEIMDQVNKWLAACEEEKWLEEYDQDENRYSAGRGAHLSLKRAEKARLTITKIPAIIESLKSRTYAWEREKKMPFLFDGIRLVDIIEDYKLSRQQKEEEKKRYRDQKKLENLLLTEKEAVFGSKPSPKRCFSNKKANGYHAHGNGNGFTTPKPRRVSSGCVTPELLTPRSYSCHKTGHFKETRRLSTAPLNFVALPKDDNGSSFASVCGSEPGSPPEARCRIQLDEIYSGTKDQCRSRGSGD